MRSHLPRRFHRATPRPGTRAVATSAFAARTPASGRPQTDRAGRAIGSAVRSRTRFSAAPVRMHFAGSARFKVSLASGGGCRINPWHRNRLYSAPVSGSGAELAPSRGHCDGRQTASHALADFGAGSRLEATTTPLIHPTATAKCGHRPVCTPESGLAGQPLLGELSRDRVRWRRRSPSSSMDSSQRLLSLAAGSSWSRWNLLATLSLRRPG